MRKVSRGVEEPILPRRHCAHAIVVYAVIGLTPVVSYLVRGTNTAVVHREIAAGIRRCCHVSRGRNKRIGHTHRPSVAGDGVTGLESETV